VLACPRARRWRYTSAAIVTLENYRSFEIPVAINGATVRFYVFNGATIAEARERVDAARALLEALPAEHLAVAFPILFIDGRLPSSGGGGGTPDHPDVLIERRSEDIGATTEAMQDLLRRANANLRRSSFHWIPRHVYDDAARVPFTVVHEVMHAVDINLVLHRRRRITPELSASLELEPSSARSFTSSDLPERLPGQACGAGNEAVRMSVNSYLSLVSGMRGVPPATRRRIVSNLRLSTAFTDVPDEWWRDYS
jgi:hypothetical protein